jgi:hypothetical protein
MDPNLFKLDEEWFAAHASRRLKLAKEEGFNVEDAAILERAAAIFAPFDPVMLDPSPRAKMPDDLYIPSLPSEEALVALREARDLVAAKGWDVRYLGLRVNRLPIDLSPLGGQIEPGEELVAGLIVQQYTVEWTEHGYQRMLLLASPESFAKPFVTSFG